MADLRYLEEWGGFELENADRAAASYLPLVNEARMISSVTPLLAGDSKRDQDSFLLPPATIETLRDSRGVREFWCAIHGEKPWSVTGASPWQRMLPSARGESTTLTAGPLWQEVVRENSSLGIHAAVCSLVPSDAVCTELMRVVITNVGSRPFTFTPTAAIPLYGRSAENIRDHRHVTSLLNRMDMEEFGIVLKPSLLFDERGHHPGETSYRIQGAMGNAEPPRGFYPIAADFTGEAGTLDWPQAVVEDHVPLSLSGTHAEGCEAFGGIRFADVTLAAGESSSFQIAMSIDADAQMYLTPDAFAYALERTKAYWRRKCAITFHTGDPRFDAWMRWVGIQPILRRICGCSFLPHHDYGKGGRGWRDLWQDSLALILLEPERVRQDLLDHFWGVRLDGSNATIIGSAPGDFQADRNHIVRMWADHGMWPLLTVDLYLQQTGDFAFLLEQRGYFRDAVIARGDLRDDTFHEEEGNRHIVNGELWMGSVLEHLLIQNVTAFFDVGEHGCVRLRGGDWNDGLDMARTRGESVAFTCAYAGNLDLLASLLESLRRRESEDTVALSKELADLLRTDTAQYANALSKRQALAAYCRASISPSGAREDFPLTEAVCLLRGMASFLRGHVRSSEWVSDGADLRWMNSYYDDRGKQVEGVCDGTVRMMLTGQVFAILSHTATEEQALRIIRAADWYLYRPAGGGYCLNTDFGEVKLDLGRMFGFAYGHKENGSVFSHMAVLYAYALYSRGFSAEGWRALEALFHQSTDFATSRIYPGIPEYFDAHGRGMYPYLTGSASWFLLTMHTQVFGVCGREGELLLHPKLSGAHFDSDGVAAMCCQFAGAQLEVRYENPSRLDFPEYRIGSAELDGRRYAGEGELVRIPRSDILSLDTGMRHTITIRLTDKQGSARKGKESANAGR